MVRAGASRRAAARLGNAALRSVLAAPGSRLAAARHAVPRLARRVRRARRRGDDGAVSARAARISRGVHVLPEAGHAARRRRAARAARARGLPARDAGRVARRIQRARRADRSLSDGQRAAVPARSLRRRHREHQDLRRRHAAHALPRPRRAAAARARVSRSTKPAGCAFAARYREVFEGDPLALAALQGREQRRRAGRHRVLPAALLREHRDARRLPAARRGRRVRRRRQRVPSQRFWYDTESRYKLLRGDKSRPLLPPTTVFLPPDAFHAALKVARARSRSLPWRSKPTRRTARAARSSRCRGSRSIAAPPTRSPRSSAISRRPTRAS